ncbi:uncharacterized protein [Henckelia pumila]|uniref:uncharacterized protein n=1 Tax=Henckelia pumila TaxID=405737 RepID=UPI003C6DEDD3
MKKLYRRGTVHPTPPAVSDHLLSFLPAAILTLTAALSLEEREVLSYLISCSSANFSDDTHHKKTSGSSKGGAAADHPPYFSCYCFRCYMSYWVKWDSSPNRQLIHEVMDAFEDSERKKEKKNKKERRKGKSIKRDIIVLELQESDKSEPSLTHQDINFLYSNTESEDDAAAAAAASGEDKEQEEQEAAEKGSIRRFMSFLGDRIWGAWG